MSGQPLDHIIKKIIDVTETISSDYQSEAFEIDRTEKGFACVLRLANGNGSVNMIFELEVSLNGNTYVPMADTDILFQDDDGTITYDILDTNMVYARIGVTVTSGSIELQTIKITGKRRH